MLGTSIGLIPSASMESWDAFARAEPDMAEKGRALLYQRGDGEGFLTTVAANGTPRIHPLNAGIDAGGLRTAAGQLRHARLYAAPPRCKHRPP